MTATVPPPQASPPSPPSGDGRLAWLNWTTALFVAIGTLIGSTATMVTNVPAVVRAIQPPPSPVAPALTLEGLVNGSAVLKDGAQVRGTSVGLRSTDLLWVVSTEIGDGLYHPQDRPCQQVQSASDGSWVCPDTFIGGPQDTGRHFYIIIYRVDGAAVDAFLDYDREKEPGTYPGMRQIPQGAEELQRVEVVRK